MTKEYKRYLDGDLDVEIPLEEIERVATVCNLDEELEVQMSWDEFIRIAVDCGGATKAAECLVKKNAKDVDALFLETLCIESYELIHQKIFDGEDNHYVEAVLLNYTVDRLDIQDNLNKIIYNSPVGEELTRLNKAIDDAYAEYRKFMSITHRIERVVLNDRV